MSILGKMKTSSAAIFLVIMATVFIDCNAYLSEAAIKKTQQMLKNVCTKKFPVEESVLANIKQGIFADDNNNLKCYFSCAFKTMQMISPKGTIEKKIFKDKMMMLAPPNVLEIMLPAIDECAGKDKEELCQNSYNFIKCSYSVNPKSLDYLPV